MLWSVNIFVYNQNGNDMEKEAKKKLVPRAKKVSVQTIMPDLIGLKPKKP